MPCDFFGVDVGPAGLTGRFRSSRPFHQAWRTELLSTSCQDDGSIECIDKAERGFRPHVALLERRLNGFLVDAVDSIFKSLFHSHLIARMVLFFVPTCFATKAVSVTERDDSSALAKQAAYVS